MRGCCPKIFNSITRKGNELILDLFLVMDKLSKLKET